MDKINDRILSILQGLNIISFTCLTYQVLIIELPNYKKIILIIET